MPLLLHLIYPTVSQQERYISRYHLRAQDKFFSTGDAVLVLSPDSTSSKVFSRWKGPGVVQKIVSKHSYLVELDGVRQHIHADKMHKYHIQVDEVCCDPAVCTVETSAAAMTTAIINQCAIIHDELKRLWGI